MGGGTLDYDGYEAYIGSTAQQTFTFSGDHDFVLIVTSGVSKTVYATYNDIKYYFKTQYSSGSGSGAILIPNVKNNTSIVFQNPFALVGFYGLSYQ